MKRAIHRKKRLNLRWVVGLVLIIVVPIALVVLVAYVVEVPPGDAAVGKPLPDFSVPQFPQGTLTFSQFRGRPVVINYLAAWCGPCWQELPYFQNEWMKHRDKGLVVIGISLQDSPKTVEYMVSRIGLDFPIGMDETGVVASRVFRIMGMPTTYFIDRKGVVQGVWRGPIHPKSLRQQIEKIL